MSGFYRFEFVHGPLDGLAVEGDTLYASRLRVPTSTGDAADSPTQTPSALYELRKQSLRWDEGAPQAVLRYEFCGSASRTGSRSWLVRWFQDRRHRMARWFKTPVDYPMSTRSQ
jgi:hypothetical protein